MLSIFLPLFTFYAVRPSTMWVYVVFEDKWWLCDDTTVQGTSPSPTPRKAIFLLYKRKPTNLLVPNMSQSASQRTRALALGNKGAPNSMPTDTSVPAMALSPGALPPPPPTCNTGCSKGWGQKHEYACPEDAY